MATTTELDLSDLITVNEAAAMVGVTHFTIRRRIADGSLPGVPLRQEDPAGASQRRARHAAPARHGWCAVRASSGGPPHSEGGAAATHGHAPADSAAAAKRTASSTPIVGEPSDADAERLAAQDAWHAHEPAHGDTCGASTLCLIRERYLQATPGRIEDVALAELLAYAEVSQATVDARMAERRELVKALHGDDEADLTAWISPLVDDKGKVVTDVDGQPVYPHPVGFRALDEQVDHVRDWALMRDAEEQRVDALAKPDFWHGLEQRDDEVEVWTRRITAFHTAYGFDLNARPLAPCFDERDVRVDMGGASLRPGDGSRLAALSAHLSARHGEHGYWASPFCQGCWGRPLAEARLQRWLLLNPGKTPQEEIPEQIPGDVLELPDEVDEAHAYLDLDALLDMPEPVMLVEGLVPQGAYGLITGRDGTGKSFLALDIAMHVVTLLPWYGGRTVDVANYGRALYLVGEGVQSFGKRVRAWLDEHGCEQPHAGDLTFRNGTVDLYGAGPAFDALLAHVVATEPDLIVIDTLARSSGAGEANSATDMSIVRERIDMLRRASNGGTVLVVAHTTKGDSDARGSSVIEDDADFVLHVDLKDDRRTQVIKVAKQKDGASGHSIALAVAPREVGDGTTLVLREPSKGAESLLTDDASTEQRVIGVLFAARNLDPLTAAQVVSASEKTRSRVYTVLSRLVEAGTVEKHEKPGRGASYSLARSAWPKDVQ